MPSSCCSVAQSCPTLCSPMECSTPSFHVLHHIPEFAHVNWVGDYQPTISSSAISFSSCLQSFPASGSFPVNQLFAWGGQSIGASASASVNQMNIQCWFLLESYWLVGSPCSPGDSQESSPTPQFKHINSLVLRLLYGPTLTFIPDY